MDDRPVILYVEDDLQSRLVMQVLLEEAMGLPYVFIFEDSAHFLERVEALDPQPDIIFLDIHVRPHDGFEMLDMLRQHPAYHATPVVALTASVMNEEVARLKISGFNGVVAKPLDQDTFPDMLSRLLRGEEVWRVIG